MFLSQIVNVATPKPEVEVADLFRRSLADYLKVGTLSEWEWKTVQLIMKYRTAAMGGYWQQCDQCGQ